MDDPGPENVNVIACAVIMVITAILEAFLYFSKSAISNLTDSKIEKLSESDAKSTRKLMIKREDILSSISYATMLLVIVFSITTSLTFSDMLACALINVGVPVTLSYIITVIVLSLCAAIVLITFSKFVPEKCGMQARDKVINRIALPVLALNIINRPAVRIASAVSRVLIRFMGLDPNASADAVTEEEILSMVDAGGETGVIEDEQREMINNIFEFDDACVSDLMTHRTDVTAVEFNDTIAGLTTLAIEEGYSRIPVYKDDMDNIVGIAYIKDLLKYVGDSVPKNLKVSDIMRKPVYVPETLSCNKLFKNMNESHTQMAIVVDEYGGTAGIITFEDLLESIVGNIQDEYDDEDEEIQKIDENVFTIDGTTDIEEVEELLKVEIPEGDYDTLGGFIISLLGYIPEDGSISKANFKNVHFTAFDVEDRRIGKVKAEVMPLLDLSAQTDEQD